MTTYEKKLLLTQLFDFYGELLTPRQTSIMACYILDDLAQSEIAQNLDISRQAVNDHISKSTKILEGYEQKLGLLNRFKERSTMLTALREELNQISHIDDIKPILGSIDAIIDF